MPDYALSIVCCSDFRLLEKGLLFFCGLKFKILVYFIWTTTSWQLLVFSPSSGPSHKRTLSTLQRKHLHLIPLLDAPSPLKPHQRSHKPGPQIPQPLAVRLPLHSKPILNDNSCFFSSLFPL
ncbi:hypothetical protein AMECASPLE_037722 [Ameca splendens]|uniref:Uncharacterized protein n=1 Tax=Ameca splendens TaxID=208324 RepID=A0ABV0YJI3_9TELE